MGNISMGNEHLRQMLLTREATNMAQGSQKEVQVWVREIRNDMGWVP